jgi:hypothetical protein
MLDHRLDGCLVIIAQLQRAAPTRITWIWFEPADGSITDRKASAAGSQQPEANRVRMIPPPSVVKILRQVCISKGPLLQ